MASVLISAALKAVPWKMLLTQAPVIIDGANTLISKLGDIRQGPRKEQEELSIRLEDIENCLNVLEENQTSQTELIKEIATQLDGLTESLRIIAARAWIATVVGVGAFGFAVAVGIWLFLRGS
jgi:hypothetical protein